jgi:hypothetical protein
MPTLAQSAADRKRLDIGVIKSPGEPVFSATLQCSLAMYVRCVHTYVDAAANQRLCYAVAAALRAVARFIFALERLGELVVVP